MANVFVNETNFYTNKEVKCVGLSEKARENPSIKHKFIAFPNPHDFQGIAHCCSNAEYVFIFYKYDWHTISVYVYDMFDHRLVHFQQVVISTSMAFSNIEYCCMNQDGQFQIYFWNSFEQGTDREIVAFELDKNFSVVKESLAQSLASFNTNLFETEKSLAINSWLKNLVRSLDKNDSRGVLSRLTAIMKNTPNCLTHVSEFTYLPYSNKLLLSGINLKHERFYQLEGQTERFVLDNDVYKFVERPDGVIVGVGRTNIIDVY